MPSPLCGSAHNASKSNVSSRVSRTVGGWRQFSTARMSSSDTSSSRNKPPWMTSANSPTVDAMGSWLKKCWKRSMSFSSCGYFARICQDSQGS